MPRSKQTKSTKLADSANSTTRNYRIDQADLMMREAIEWIEDTQNSIYALSETTLLLSRPDGARMQRIHEGIHSLWGAIDAQLVQAIGHIEDARRQL